ncbi:L-serine dehydratase [Clostridium tetanomorphum]|uniref:L-serine ammonia-lyase, iron-sulfur-dependent, subunit alpha n=1 Tax=Clostridium tetanomorphum TaxID=1553 RepID=UPI0004527C1B|nr:L-serine ammonia-lyase, iron-sulfur-dependent, subunit alpha [Clostridium tetanomorphum]KAJ49478.1 L-serine dehydratase, iron-sulfur-dependent subunit alpha [Clostridium tetanomorphum DSM 665]KAJ51445.1 L-serine dehydratase, iron-sulfur-dependent subunit alpha [Clostridium tetanomorphum DSM 665]MBP1863864.1 L-serine dehydratase [Clostridium tetanomorphum]NRS84942.1 L-serine dehydratase [Clostridium tetanomorphum]SQB91538.1 L-serine dehydratase, iron-sulfur-dependent subunit alpha [Clostridi
MFVSSGKELIEICKKEGLTISEYTIREEISKSGIDRKKIMDKMAQNLNVMKNSSEFAQENQVRSVSGLIGGDAVKLKEFADSGKTLTGEFMVRAMARAISSSEVNAAMGKIVACPTAGSCGILPAVIISAGEKLNKSEEELVNALFTASGVGIIIAKNATLSGAEGGCQAECGSAAAMASAAVVEMMGGTVEQALDAAAIVIKNILGLVCDPVAGLVEVPCAKRNIAGTVNALTTADIVMSGVKSMIPFDEVVWAMYKVGKQLSPELRETALGGIAITPTALKLKKEIFK